MGKFSRNKGRREEQQLVLYLSRLNYKAERILRQYQSSGQPDVIATKDGKTYTFEKKARKASFKTLYEVYHKEKDLDGVLRISGKDLLVAMSTDFKALEPSHHDKLFRGSQEFSDRFLTRLSTLKGMKQAADFLVVKDNGCAQLFLRFW